MEYGIRLKSCLIKSLFIYQFMNKFFRQFWNTPKYTEAFLFLAVSVKVFVWT